MTLVTIVHPDKSLLIPLIFAFKIKIKKHILVFDESKEDIHYAAELKQSLDTLAHKYSLLWQVEMVQIDEDDKNDMIGMQQKLKIEESCSLYLNAAGADTALLVVLSGFILQAGGRVLAYDKHDNSYNEVSLEGFTNRKVTDNMMIDDFLLLTGETLTEESDRREAYESHEALTTLFGDMKRMFKVRAILTKQGQYNKDKKIVDALQTLNIIGASKKLKDNTKITQFGNLFESFVFLQMSHYDFDDIKMGLKVTFEQQSRKGKQDIEVSNEFDILTIKDNRIGLVECKIGNITSATPVSIIYKSDALMDYFGNDSRGLIINIQPDKTPHLASSKLNFSELTTFRANTKRIEIFNAFDFGKKKFGTAVERIFSVVPRVFLMGGHDLEMIAIRHLLDRTHQRYFDRKLQWGAKLSDYANLLNDREHFYAIELDIDIDPPKHFTLIDHHNDKQERPAAIIQIASLLGYPVDRFYQLVAVNDVGHIKALKKFGASDKEIMRIRELDRKAQGVSQEDECQAVRDIEAASTVGDIVVVKTSLEKFSPITDRLYDKNLLVFTDTKLTYYGRDIKRLIKYFHDFVDTRKAYYGGKYGFFGIADGYFDKKDIEEIKKEILNRLTEE